jgi:hypothetical protein
VDLAGVCAGGGRAAAWIAATQRPKVVVATQTRVGEAAVDALGTWVPSTPAIAVLAEPDDLWLLAAVICSPVGTLAALGQVAGSGRARDAIRHRAATILELPLPVDRDAWSAGADALRRQDLDHFAAAMSVAYAVEDPDDLIAWWHGRRPRDH